MSVLIKGVTKIELMKALVQSPYFLPDDIEIIEVHTPHGRLIDEDRMLRDCEYPEVETYTMVALESAPTVIEAEE